MSAKSERARREYEETQEAFAAVRQALVDRVLATAIGESLLRDKLVLTVQALDEVQTVLLGVAQTGDLEEYAAQLRKLTEPAG
jgi:hypothetical protein